MREQIIDFLRRELVGPDPIPTMMQENGEEILENDSPTVRYGAGVLFPRQTPTQESEREDSGETEVILDEPIIDDKAQPEPEKSVGGTIDISRDETTEEAVGLANSFKPSAMGISFLAEISDNDLIVEIGAGKYQTESVTVDGREKRRYPRTAISSRVVLTADELKGNAAKTFRRDVLNAEGNATGLELYALSRPESGVARLMTLSLINKNVSEGERFVTDKCLFQVAFAVASSDGKDVFVEYPEKKGESLDNEELALRLLYKHRKTFAVGHGCAADWEERGERAVSVSTAVLPVYDVKPIIPNILPNLTLSMLEFSDLKNETNPLETLRALCDKYEDWIKEREKEAENLETVLRPAADAHLKNCRACLGRMRKGVSVLERDKRAMLAFRLMNRAMLSQQLHFALPLREHKKDESKICSLPPASFPDFFNPGDKKGKWYPFQLAFILMNVACLADPSDEDRTIADLIWFPTGGGKTEAYLGLTALTIFLRRLKNPLDAGVVVLMRYTLRLLTAQQFQRAAALICACELIRKEKESLLGTERISIGLWVGGELTPNERKGEKGAIKSLDKLYDDKHTKLNPFVLLRCPWCSAQMGVTKECGVQGYKKSGSPATVLFVCPDAACPFSANSFPLPLYVIDEDIYEKMPSLVIGTVDKFAMIAWKPETKSLFAKNGKGYTPPELIIQDELHLISGPLGSMVGHYETVIDEFCVNRTNGVAVPAKIVASTATIRRAEEQVAALFDRKVFQFPPQALRAGESFFATEDTKAEGRTYVGVHASALSSHVTTQVRVFSALLQASLAAEVVEEIKRDPYYTLLCYFNNLRELGHAATLIHADIPEYMKTTVWDKKQIAKERRRYINKYLELTSRVDSAEITEALQDLERKYGTEDKARAVDICLATNMISVGVDVPRLGLMCVVGQPKTTSEYIQATSRVGRDKNAPGLVVTIYNTGKPRDRSHYEHFRTYHSTLYKQVEPTSVTPWAIPVRKRALHALLVSMIRILGTAENASAPNPFPDERLIEKALEIIEKRVTDIDEGERKAVLKEASEFLEKWKRLLPAKYGSFGVADASAPLMYPAGSFPLPEWDDRATSTPSSMRSVDRTCQAQPMPVYPQPEVVSSADGE
jgi:hypothetical protein